MTTHESPYTDRQWRRIENYLCPDTEDANWRCRLFDPPLPPWRDQVLDAVIRALQAKGANQKASTERKERKRRIESGIKAANALLGWIDRRLADGSLGETPAIRCCREPTQALIDDLKTKLRGPGRPAGTWNDPTWNALLTGLVAVFDFFNWQSPLRTGGLSVADNRRFSSYLKACLEPLTKRYPNLNLPPLNPANLRQAAKRLREFKAEQFRKAMEGLPLSWGPLSGVRKSETE
jgi:hypothetical protein